MFNVAIIGAESFDNYDFCKEKCIKCLKKKADSGESITIHTTGDSFVDQFSKRYHINVKTFYANWQIYGKMALKQRNSELINGCNAMIIFDNQTKDIDILKKLAIDNEIPIRVFQKPI
jgi:hypothetical protein